MLLDTTRPAPFDDGRLEPTVCVIGDACELDAVYPQRARIVRVVPNAPESEPAPIVLVVLDARTHSLRELAEARRSPQLASVPALVVADREDDTALHALRADDIVTAPFDRAIVANRVRTLIELGSTRFTLMFAQQALEHSVSGLTIGDNALGGSPLVYASSVFEKLTGYSIEDVRGRDCRLLQGPGTDPEARARLREAVREKRSANVTLLNYKKDGTPFWNEVTVFPVRTPDGQPLSWMGGVQHDVTQLIEARAEVERLYGLLLQRQESGQAILDGVDVGIITTDATGRVKFVNRCALEVLGREGDLSGEDVGELLELTGGHAGALLPSQTERRWAHSLWATGAEVEIELTVHRAPETDRDHLGFFYIFHDRTQEKQAEMERRRFERLAAMGTMVAGFAHEVRNPMASLRSIAESLNEELVEADVKLPHVDRMLKVLERVEGLVRTSLLFGRPSPPRRAAHRPWTILSTAVSSVLPRTRLMGGELGIEADVELPDVSVDDGQLVQVLVILLNNALDATSSPRRVVLRAEWCPSSTDARTGGAVPQFVRFSVSDDGAGIPAEILGQVFDPFFTTKASGTGLGLSIAQQLVTENGGRIELTSPQGGPTTFGVLVPIVSGPVDVSSS